MEALYWVATYTATLKKIIVNNDLVEIKAARYLHLGWLGVARWLAWHQLV